jgi:arylformamidase
MTSGAPSAAASPEAAIDPPIPEPDRREMAERIATLQAELVEARERLTLLSEALAEIEQNPFWRATAPLRRLAAVLPAPVRRGLLGMARGIYWGLTPHRMPGRLRWIRYEPVLRAAVRRLEQRSAAAYQRLGPPLRLSYGTSAVERLDVFSPAGPKAPIFLFVHGGAWREGEAGNYAFAAEMFVAAGAHYATLDFVNVREAGGDPRLMAEQVRRGIAWLYRHAEGFGGDPERLYVGGHSSGAHLCAVALTTDWQGQFGVPGDIVKGAVLMSGVYDMGPVRRADSNPYLRFSDEIEDALSPIRHVDRLQAPVVITCGSGDTPEFRQQSHDFFAALRQAGKPAELVEGAGLGHMEMLESLADPCGTNGRAALGLMALPAPGSGPASSPSPDFNELP